MNRRDYVKVSQRGALIADMQIGTRYIRDLGPIGTYISQRLANFKNLQNKLDEAKQECVNDEQRESLGALIGKSFGVMHHLDRLNELCPLAPTESNVDKFIRSARVIFSCSSFDDGSNSYRELYKDIVAKLEDSEIFPEQLSEKLKTLKSDVIAAQERVAPGECADIITAIVSQLPVSQAELVEAQRNKAGIRGIGN